MSGIYLITVFYRIRENRPFSGFCNIACRCCFHLITRSIQLNSRVIFIQRILEWGYHVSWL